MSLRKEDPVMSLEKDFGHRQAGVVADPFVVHDVGLSEVPLAWGVAKR